MKKWHVRKRNGVWLASRRGEWPKRFRSWQAAIAAVLVAEACNA